MILKLIKNLDEVEMTEVYFTLCLSETVLDFIDDRVCMDYRRFANTLKIYGGHFFINTEFIITEEYGMVKPYHMIVDSFAARAYDPNIELPENFVNFIVHEKSILHWNNSIPFSLS